MPMPKPIPSLTPRQLARFSSRIDRRGSTDCWEWRRGHGRYKYGYISLAPRGKFLAHRVAYMLRHRSDPGRLLVCHTCDNTRCCNPEHLFLGTCADNLADMRKKGRGGVGERNSRAKLTPESVREILKSDEPQRVLARRYGISPPTVSAIRLGKIWDHIGDRSHIIHGPRRGNRCPFAKLRKDQVRRIRKSDKTVVALAREFGVAPSTIRGVLNGRTWGTVA